MRVGTGTGMRAWLCDRKTCSHQTAGTPCCRESGALPVLLARAAVLRPRKQCQRRSRRRHEVRGSFPRNTQPGSWRRQWARAKTDSGTAGSSNGITVCSRHTTPTRHVAASGACQCRSGRPAAAVHACMHVAYLLLACLTGGCCTYTRCMITACGTIPVVSPARTHRRACDTTGTARRVASTSCTAHGYL